MKRIILALLAVLFVPSLYALNAGPSEVRIGDFECRSDGRTNSFNSGRETVVDYRCYEGDNYVGNLFITYYAGVLSQEERLRSLKEIDRGTRGENDGKRGQFSGRRAAVGEGMDVALVKADLYLDGSFKAGLVTMARFDSDRSFVLQGKIDFAMLQQKFSQQEQVQKMLEEVLKFKFPEDPRRL